MVTLVKNVELLAQSNLNIKAFIFYYFLFIETEMITQYVILKGYYAFLSFTRDIHVNI